MIKFIIQTKLIIQEDWEKKIKKIKNIHIMNNFNKEKNYILHKDRIEFNETIICFSSNKINH